MGVQTHVPDQAHYAGITIHNRQVLLFLASSGLAASGPLGLELVLSTISQLSACTAADGHRGVHYLRARTARISHPWLAMSTRRLSTIHDLASLRLHPDGTRVQSSDKNLRIRASKYAARDSKGNWFARDAGGTGEVKQRFAKSHHEDSEEEESTEAEAESAAKSKGKQGIGLESEDEGGFRDYRARKRLRYLADDSFIAPTTSGAPSTQGSPQASSSRLSSESPRTISELPTPNAVSFRVL